jgi:predicted nucleic acid-binding protein
VILVDSNVIIDVLTQDPRWRRWSQAALIDAADRDEIAINPIIYAEIASGFATMAELDHHLRRGSGLRRIPPTRRRADVSAA